MDQMFYQKCPYYDLELNMSFPKQNCEKNIFILILDTNPNKKNANTSPKTSKNERIYISRYQRLPSCIHRVPARIHEWCTPDSCSRDTCSPDICSRDTCSPMTFAPERHLLPMTFAPQTCSPIPIIDQQADHHLHEKNRMIMFFFLFLVLITYLISYSTV